MLLRSKEVSEILVKIRKEFVPELLNVRLVAHKTWQWILKQTFLPPWGSKRLQRKGGGPHQSTGDSHSRQSDNEPSTVIQPKIKKTL